MIGYDAKHCCGSAYGKKGYSCPHIYLHNGETGEKDPATGKVMKQYYVYCRRGGKLKCLGHLASWTGLTPKDCPERQRREREADG